MVNPVISKLSYFETKIARRIVGQGRSTIDFRALIAEQKLVVVSLAKGVAGDDVASLIGATFLGLLTSALAEQSQLAPGARQGYAILVDEFQTIPGACYAEMLAELRKFGVAVTLATQSFEYLHALDSTLLPTVLANVRQLVIYRMSAQDALRIHWELVVEEDDILHLDSHVCYIKMSLAGRLQPTFSLQVMLPPPGDPEAVHAIMQRCRDQYTRTGADVESQLSEALVRNIRAKSLHQEAHNKEPSVAKEAPIASGVTAIGEDNASQRTRGRKSEEERRGPITRSQYAEKRGSSRKTSGQGTGQSQLHPAEQHMLISMELEQGMIKDQKEQ